MAMTKPELEKHSDEYHALMARARAAEQQGLVCEAVEVALSSWQYIDGMMQYERKYEDEEFASVEAIDIVLEHAPLLLDFQSLDRLEVLLKDFRRIDKNTSESLADKLANGRALMWDAHRLWDHLEQHPEARQDQLRQILGGDQNKWRSIAETWENMGLVRRTPEGGSYRLALSTRMEEVVSAKCSSCGAVAKAPKAMFFEQQPCPRCGATVHFVLLCKDTAAGTRE